MPESAEESKDKIEGMDKKSKVLLWIVILSIFISIGVTFYKTMILQDFEVVNTEETEEEIIIEE